MTKDQPAPGRTDTWKLPASKTRLVVLGDPHGDLVALAEVLAREDRPEVAIVSVGDNVGYTDGPTSSELCRILEEKKIPSVTGNHEAWSEGGKLFLSSDAGQRDLTPEARRWLESLPYRIRIEAEAAPDLAISVVHTLPEWAYVNEENADRLAALEGAAVTFCGHTHAPAVYTVVGGKLAVKRLEVARDVPLKVPLARNARYVVDAGSLGRPSSRGRRTLLERGTYAALDLADRTVRVYSFSKRKRLQELLRMAIEENTARSRRARGSGP